MASLAFQRLLRWLGPWASEDALPPEVVREEHHISPSGGGPETMKLWTYRPSDRAPLGAYLVAPGLHFAGPADPRLDRFLRILAHAGFVVVAPFLPDFIALRVGPRLVEDLAQAWGWLLQSSARPQGVAPGVFSISFGSLPAIHLAANPDEQQSIGGLIVFGGYADFEDTLRFAVGAPSPLSDAPLSETETPRDPLNLPVVFLNLLDSLPFPSSATGPVALAWTEYAQRTWGQPEMKERRRHQAVAEELAEGLDTPERELFFLGCGLRPGAAAVVQEALSSRPPAEFLDPRPHLTSIRCPMRIFHGRDDDVIPYRQAYFLKEALADHPDCRTYVTGLYHHTGHAGFMEMLERIPQLMGEFRTLVGMVRAMVHCGSREDKRGSPATHRSPR